MQDPDLIRRRWPGFGECRITVAPIEVSAAVSLADRIFAGVPRLLSRNGLGSLSFTVDPTWILQESQPVTGPIVAQFLRVHRRALAEEWQSLQGANAAPAPPSDDPVAMPVRREVEAGPAGGAPQPAPTPQGGKGLPSWFESYCAGTGIQHQVRDAQRKSVAASSSRVKYVLGNRRIAAASGGPRRRPSPSPALRGA